MCLWGEGLRCEWSIRTLNPRKEFSTAPSFAANPQNPRSFSEMIPIHGHAPAPPPPDGMVGILKPLNKEEPTTLPSSLNYKPPPTPAPLWLCGLWSGSCELDESLERVAVLVNDSTYYPQPPPPPLVYGPVACGLGLVVYTRFMDGL